jgi:hypothetical protein
MTFSDPDGQAAMWLIAWPGVTTGLAFGDADGNAIGLIVERDNMRLTFADNAGQARVALGLTPEEPPSLVLADREGTPRAELSLQEDEDPQLLFSDKYASERARIGLQRGRPLIDFLDETGKTLWTAP